MINLLMSSLYAFLILIGILLSVPMERINPTLAPYLKEYVHTLEEVCPGIEYYKPIKKSIDFADLPKPLLGICLKNQMGYVIRIDRGFWARADEAARYDVVMHEFTHCLLNQRHSNDINNFMFPSKEKNLSKIEVREQIKEYADKLCVKGL